MSRYIDAKWLTKYFQRGKEYKGEYVLDDLKYDAPSIDICFCKDCEHYKYDWCHRLANVVKADDFCSYGERGDE